MRLLVEEPVQERGQRVELLSKVPEVAWAQRQEEVVQRQEEAARAWHQKEVVQQEAGREAPAEPEAATPPAVAASHFHRLM